MRKPVMKFLLAGLCLGLSFTAAAQKILPKPEAFPPGSAEARAQERCRAARGVDCDTRAGLREWMREDVPLTPEQQQAAAAARRHREECAHSRKKPGC